MNLKYTFSKRLSIIDTYQNIIIKGIEDIDNTDALMLVFAVENGINEHKCLLSYYTQCTLIDYLISNKLDKYYTIKQCADNADIEINFSKLIEDKLVFNNIFIGKLESKKSGKAYTALLKDNKDDLLDRCETLQDN